MLYELKSYDIHVGTIKMDTLTPEIVTELAHWVKTYPKLVIAPSKVTLNFTQGDIEDMQSELRYCNDEQPQVLFDTWFCISKAGRTTPIELEITVGDDE